MELTTFITSFSRDQKEKYYLAKERLYMVGDIEKSKQKKKKKDKYTRLNTTV